MAEPMRVLLEDAEILGGSYRNFTGRETQYNQAGRRNFCVFIDDPDLIRDMEKDGWNIKWTKEREEGDEPRAFIKVIVRYDNRPPKIYMVTSRGKTFLPEDLVSLLDGADITKADMIINSSEYKPGEYAAYLRTMFVTVEEDELDRKYENVPDAGAGLHSVEEVED